MTVSTIDPATGNLLVNGQPVFPLGLSDPPPFGTTAPDGQDAWAAVASAGTSFVRNYTVWAQAGLDEQLIAVGEQLDAAPAHGLQLWLALAGVDNDLSQQPLLDQARPVSSTPPACAPTAYQTSPTRTPRERSPSPSHRRSTQTHHGPKSRGGVPASPPDPQGTEPGAPAADEAAPACLRGLHALPRFPALP